MMGALYFVQRARANANIVDFGWAAGVGGVALWYAAAAPGDGAHRLALAVVGSLWAFRLSFYLLRDRVLYAKEDGRYRVLRESWGARAQRNFLIFFLAQAALVVLFSAPHLMTALRPGPGLSPWGWCGVVVGLGAILGETIADRQLRRWRDAPANRGRTCRSGLWRYSRHPNYFFEWLQAVSFALFVSGLQDGLFAWVSPALLLFLLFNVTGIKPSEEHSVKTRLDYADYVKRTSVFVPWPRRDLS
ncbi:MAG TPA: DUF1295 domain-containing protein [Candidatus Hydrogenedentes bacterium]|nr:DUF1295 domain-containing protein [Candidatus Hydrogenedentota bacterium]